MVERVLDRRLRDDTGPRRLLDAGCGRGDFAVELAARYPALEEIVGCDFSPELVELATSGAAGQPRIRFVTGDVTSLAFTPAGFDVTVCLNVLHHIRNERLPTALQQLARVTSRVLLLEIKNASSPYFRLHSKRVEGIAVYPVTIEEVSRRLGTLGFRLIQSHAIFGLDWLSPLVLLHFERAPSP